jgi:hypothetical protein
MEMNKALEQETGTWRKSKGAYTCEEQEEYLWIHLFYTDLTTTGVCALIQTRTQNTVDHFRLYKQTHKSLIQDFI